MGRPSSLCSSDLCLIPVRVQRVPNSTSLSQDSREPGLSLSKGAAVPSELCLRAFLVRELEHVQPADGRLILIGGAEVD